MRTIDGITRAEIEHIKVALAAAEQANDPQVEQLKREVAEIADTLMRWVWGLQRLLGRMGFLARFPFHWRP